MRVFEKIEATIEVVDELEGLEAKLRGRKGMSLDFFQENFGTPNFTYEFFDRIFFDIAS